MDLCFKHYCDGGPEKLVLIENFMNAFTLTNENLFSVFHKSA